MTGHPWIPEDWPASLDAPARERAERLIRRMEQLGAPDPAEWVYSEMTEDIPQLAIFLVLRRLWPEHIDSWRDSPHWIPNMIRAAEVDPTDYFADAGQALKRLIAAGVREEDIKSIARFVAYETTFGVLVTLDDGCDPDSLEEGPGWALMETDAEGNLTGRQIDGLHESILSLDPSGREGRPR